MLRWFKNKVKRIWPALFHFCQRLGFDILPRHFYSEIPDIRKLKRTQSWKKPYSMVGVAGAELEGQVVFLRDLFTPERVQRIAKGDIHREACRRNGEAGFGAIEADVLFAFVVTRRPARIVQIGCGVSTAICLMAAEESGYRASITCIEPYPTAFLKQAASADQIELLAKPVEDVELSQFEQLQSGDLLFIDSSHTLGPAGEVSRMILEILPRLRPGVFVHFHDIYFPYDYQGHLLTDSLFFSHESVLLHAFLCQNPRFRIGTSLSMIHHARLEEIKSLMPHYTPRKNDEGLAASEGHFPSSAYLEVTAP